MPSTTTTTTTTATTATASKRSTTARADCDDIEHGKNNQQGKNEPAGTVRVTDDSLSSASFSSSSPNNINNNNNNIQVVLAVIEPGTDTSCTWIEAMKYIGSTIFFLFCVTLVTAAIFTKQTVATSKYSLNPILAFILFWTLLLWLAVLEGGLNAMVGLKPVPFHLYQDTHTLTSGCTNRAHAGDNLERFIVGRQYLDLSIVFSTGLLVSTIDNVSVLGLPQPMMQIFLSSGLAVTLCTIIIGQLAAQINSSRCMLDFMNNRVMYLSTYLALLVEATGILHAVYFIQMIASKLSGQTLLSDEPKKTLIQSIGFWIRVTFSTSLLLFAIVVTVKAILDGHTAMWESVPPIVSLLLLVVLTLVAGLMESLQIAFMAFTNRGGAELDDSPEAKRNYDLVFTNNSTLQSFLIGRQILQTIIMFVFARIVTINLPDDDDSVDNIFGVNDAIQSIFNSGVLGILIAVILSSLCWRVLASNFPKLFLQCKLSRPIIYLCIYTEATGICYVAWMLAGVHKRLANLHIDRTYLGTLAEMLLGATGGGGGGGATVIKEVPNNEEDVGSTSHEGDNSSSSNNDSSISHSSSHHADDVDLESRK